MKQFRTSIFLFCALSIVAFLYFRQSKDKVLDQSLETPEAVKPIELFQFEKKDVKRVEITRPQEKAIILVEKDGKWLLENINEPANRTMVNRIKHQLHDLKSRATVVENPEQPELYGLGANAITVKIDLADGSRISLNAGDPNPQGVSHYIQRLPSNVVYTVKKSAVDFFSSPFDAFREPRFIIYDTKDIVSLRATYLENAPKLPLQIQKNDAGWWEMLSPLPMAADGDKVKRMLGRVTSLKAKRFVDIDDDKPTDLQLKGRLKVEITNSKSETKTLFLLGTAPESSEREKLSFYRTQDSKTIFVARSGVFAEFDVDVESLRNRQLLRVNANDITSIDVSLHKGETVDFEGQASVRFQAEQWLWTDGVPVPGSTPKRTATALAGMKAIAFYDQSDSAIKKAFNKPIAEALVKTSDKELRVIFGIQGEPKVDAEGNTYPRRFVQVNGQSYLVDERAFRVLQDMVRERNRKRSSDDEKSRLQQRIPSNSVVKP